MNSNSNVLVGSMKGNLMYPTQFLSQSKVSRSMQTAADGVRPCDDVVGMGHAVASYIAHVGYSRSAELFRHAVRCDL